MPSTMTIIDGMHAFLLIILLEKTMRRKIMLMFTGVIGMGIFLSFLLGVGYGTDTSSFMNASVASRLNMSLGSVMLTINAILFIPEIIWGRKMIGIGTIANMTLIGYTSDFCTFLEGKYLPSKIFTAQPYRTITFAIALVLFLVSAALYMNAGLGLTPFDAIPAMASEHIPIPFYALRMAWDFIAIAIGLIASGSLTIGTVIMAFTVGPAVSWIGRRIHI